MFRHIPNKSLASNTCSKHDTIGANFAQEFKDHLFILASFFVRITYFKDAFRRPLHTDPNTFFHPNTQLQAKFFEPVVTFTLISNLVTDYIQKRTGKALLSSFEYNLSPNLISK